VSALSGFLVKVKIENEKEGHQILIARIKVIDKKIAFD
jgi:hypothetical protein